MVEDVEVAQDCEEADILKPCGSISHFLSNVLFVSNCDNHDVSESQFVLFDVFLCILMSLLLLDMLFESYALSCG